MDKKNLLIIGGVAVMALLLMLLMPLMPAPAVDEDTVIVRVGQEEYARIPLSQPQQMTIEQENGAVNVLEVTSRGMMMLSSTCDNQVCVHKGEVTLDNWELKGGAFVYCAPNQVMLELVEAKKE